LAPDIQLNIIKDLPTVKTFLNRGARPLLEDIQAASSGFYSGRREAAKKIKGK
jgi:hypothetical protein